MATKYNLKLKKYKQSGDIDWQYHPLRNIKGRNGIIKNFVIKNNTSGFNFNLENPVDIECQQAYDGTVNLIINDGINSPKLVNSRWSNTGNDTYRIINREQINQTNLYREDLISSETSLFRSIRGVTKINLLDVMYSGKLKAGNYIFYLKYMDEDYNETDVVAQSGVVSIFNGTIISPHTVSGGIMDEETDKSISLHIKDIDTSFSYLKLYVYRTTCDSNGVKLSYSYKIDTDYNIDGKTKIININGFEPTIDISIEELNIDYLKVDAIKSQAQVQNMLFFANVTKTKEYDSDLQLMSLYVKAQEVLGDNIGYVNPASYQRRSNDDIHKVEYYSPLNIYYKLGYWPDEIYRFGIVYIYDNDKTSPVYNLRGCRFTDDRDINIKKGDFNGKYEEYIGIEKTDRFPFKAQMLNNNDYINTGGVFQFNKNLFNRVLNDDSGITPIGIQFSVNEKFIKDLHKKGIKGFFFVRQERIPTILCQGYSVGVNKVGYFPMIKYKDYYVTESFADSWRWLEQDVKYRLYKVKDVKYSGLLCVDAYLNRNIQSMLDTSEFMIEDLYDESDLVRIKGNRYYYPKDIKYQGLQSLNCNLIYIDQDIPYKIFQDEYTFSTKAGVQEDIKYNAYIYQDKKDYGWDTLEGQLVEVDAYHPGHERDHGNGDTNGDFALTRGSFTSFIGVNKKLNDGHVYNVRIKNYNSSFLYEYFNTRIDDKSPFYQIGERYCITPDKTDSDWSIFQDYAVNESEGNINFRLPITFGGDCFSSTVTTRMHRNFISSSVPVNDVIIDEETFRNFCTVRDTDWTKINKADVDAVQIGSWVTYKCLSNFNTSLRCIDPFQVDEQAIFGNSRSFYPAYGISTKSAWKIPESNISNQGYSSLLGVKRNFTRDQIPYEKDMFDTRIMFSNIQVDGEFKNSYRIFQGLSYEDVDRQYGSITKIVPWGVNLFCVFEHGLAIIPVNEKALIQTTAGQNIHMYGAGVLQKQVVLISDKIGSTWKDSIIKTPVAIYGVDSHTHKIWRYSNELNLEILSDFKIQRFLHDNINLKSMDKNVILGSRNIKAHYNAFKSDVMFTYYNRGLEWNLCYNETIGKWTTKYSWIPIMSENVDYSMFSFDLMRTKIFSTLNTNLNRSKNGNEAHVVYTCNTPGQISSINGNAESVIGLDLKLNNDYTYYNINDLLVKAYYWDSKNNRINFDVLGLECFDNLNINNVESNGESVSSSLYQYYKENVCDIKHNIKFLPNHDINEQYLYFNIEIDYTPYYVYENEDSGSLIFGNGNKKYTIGLIKSYELYKNSKYHDDYCNALINSIYVHGRSLNADEINYNDYDLTNQCLPTKWYDRQEPFEFEVTLSEPKGAHKLFNNLMIISNNVEPDSLEIEITGDAYTFNKSEIFKYDKGLSDTIPNDHFDSVGIDKDGNEVYNTEVKYDTVENSYSLLVHQKLLNIKDYGRRLGNIIYNEDKWYITLAPIYYKTKSEELRSTKIRDKYAKVRVKYKGDKLVVLVALQTVMTLSFV